ncbi:class I SAM-dependent methyltransferase [Paraburkholderia strydomiana]
MDRGPAFLETTGYCHCCRAQVTFRSESDWLRDNYICLQCKSIPRNRHLHYVLDTKFPGWEKAKIHECSPVNDFAARFARRWSRSVFEPNVPLGSMHRGVRCENIEAMTFADNTFDIFITEDVLEHVFHPDKAIAEIMRVLRPGGAHVFTAPKQKWITHTRQCAKLVDNEIEHILEPQYHIAANGGGSLVTWEYGYDFELLLSEWAGNVPVETHRMVDRSKGIDAEFNEVFVIRKPVAPGRHRWLPRKFGSRWL